jgi:hypothetical protein
MSTHEDNTGATLEGLRKLLDSHGANRSRWPARERLKYSHLISENLEARRLVSEAAALDALLDEAPEPAADDVAALRARVLAAAGIADGPGHAAPFPLRRTVARPARESTFGWRAGALLAASLLLGIFAGGSELVSDPVQTFAAVTGDSNTANTTGDEASPLAWGLDDGASGQEDIL